MVLKKRLLIVSTVNLYSMDENEILGDLLAFEARQNEFIVDHCTLPVAELPIFSLEQIAAYRLLDFKSYGDLVITVGYPACLIQHPDKRSYITGINSAYHQRYNTEFGALASPEHERIRRSIFAAEKKYLEECNIRICDTNHLKTMVETDLGITIQKINPVLMHTISDTGTTLFDHKVVVPTNLEPHERIDLLLQTLAKLSEGIEIEFFIPTANKVYSDAFDQSLISLGLKNRVTLRTELNSPLDVKNATLVKVPYLATSMDPIVTASLAGGARLITCNDSGAYAEAANLHNGSQIISPDPHAILAAINKNISGNHKKTKLEPTVVTTSPKALFERLMGRKS